MELSLKLDATKWIEFIEKKKGALMRNRVSTLIDLGNTAIMAAQSKLPSGKLRESIGKPTAGGIYEIKAVGDMVVLTLGTALPYSAFVERGVGPHLIMAKNKKFMKFYWELFDEVFYFKKVHHPGMKGKWYMTEAQNAVITKMARDGAKVFE